MAEMGASFQQDRTGLGRNIQKISVQTEMLSAPLCIMFITNTKMFMKKTMNRNDLSTFCVTQTAKEIPNVKILTYGDKATRKVLIVQRLSSKLFVTV